MTELTPVSASDVPATIPSPESKDFLSTVAKFFTVAIDNSDEQAARERVAILKAKNPNAGHHQLVDMLIKQKSVQAGTLGAATSAVAIVPGLGTAVSLLLGVPLDIGITFKWQAELVLEVAAVYGRELSPEEKRTAVLIVTGLSTGTTRLARKAGQTITQKAAARFTGKYATKAIPVVGVAFSGGANVLTTYLIGKRAEAYFALSPEDVGDWSESVRALSGVDERKIGAYIQESTQNVKGLLSRQASNARQGLQRTGKKISARLPKRKSKTKGALPAPNEVFAVEMSDINQEHTNDA